MFQICYNITDHDRSNIRLGSKVELVEWSSLAKLLLTNVKLKVPLFRIERELATKIKSATTESKEMCQGDHGNSGQEFSYAQNEGDFSDIIDTVSYLLLFNKYSTITNFLLRK
jgi:hypothetical protein